MLSFDLAAAGETELKIFDGLGRELEVVFSGTLDAGSYSFSFDASAYPSGVYFYTLSSGVFSKTRKMVLLK
ncbi:MAG TPA: T9SS type A sorting domain-containing protein [Ignavibacteria bacterium]|nr:T9SS type A sorting domain-containing protein [Ignavibacteria bacterium]